MFFIPPQMKFEGRILESACLSVGLYVDYRLSIHFNPFSAGTAFMLMQTGWIQASRRVTRSNLFATWSTIPNKKQAEFKGFKKQTTI